jgi:polar amino acid transport system substrate-binding protein
VEPITVLRDQQNAKKLMAGQIDLWATGDPAFRQRRVVSGLNKDVPDEVVQKLQTELEQMRSEGLVDDILSRYL